LFAAVLLGAALSCPNPTFSAILGKYAPTESMGFYLSVRYAAGPAGVAITGLILPLGLNYVGWQASLWVVAVLCVLASLAVGRAVGLIDWRNNRMPTDLSPTSSLVAVLSLSHLRFLCLVALSYSMMQQGFLSFSVLILVRQGVPLSTAAGLLSLSQLVSFLARVVLGHASDDWSSHRLVLAAQGVAMGVACLSLAWLPTSPSIILAAVVMIATGTLTMSWVAVLFAQLMRILPLSKVSTCSTGVQVFTFGGSVVSPFLISALLENGISHAIIFTCLSGITAVTGTALSMHGPSREAERAIGESTEG
jgi:MFS family permease